MGSIGGVIGFWIDDERPVADESGRIADSEELRRVLCVVREYVDLTGERVAFGSSDSSNARSFQYRHTANTLPEICASLDADTPVERETTCRAYLPVRVEANRRAGSPDRSVDVLTERVGADR